MIAHKPAMASYDWPGAQATHLLKLAGAQTQEESCLLSREKGGALFCPNSTLDIVNQDNLLKSKDPRAISAASKFTQMGDATSMQ